MPTIFNGEFISPKRTWEALEGVLSDAWNENEDPTTYYPYDEREQYFINAIESTGGTYMFMTQNPFSVFAEVNDKFYRFTVSHLDYGYEELTRHMYNCPKNLIYEEE